MVICVVTPWWPRSKDDTEGIFVRDQVEVLKSAGYELKVVTPHLPDWWPALFKLAAFTLRGFYHITRGPRPHIIHAHVTIPAGFVAVLAGKWMNVPVVLTEHSSPWDIQVDRWWKRLLVEWTLSRCDAVCAVGDRLAKDMGAPNVVHNVVRRAFLEVHRNSRKHVRSLYQSDRVRAKDFAFIGGFHDRKGVIELAVALRILYDSDRRFIFHGNGPRLWQLHAIAGLLPGVHINSFKLGREHVLSLLEFADCVVIPSKHESFGVAAVEAAIAGCVVIVGQDTETARLLYGHANATACHPAAIAEAITNAETGLLIRPHPEILYARFGEEAFLRRINKLYDNVLQDRLTDTTKAMMASS